MLETYLVAILKSLCDGGRANMMWRLVLTRDTKNLVRSTFLFGCSLFMAGTRACMYNMHSETTRQLQVQ